MPRGRPRDKVLQLRLTMSELEALRAISDRRGWTCAQLLRDLVRRELLRAQERGDLLDFEMSLPALARDLKAEGYMRHQSPTEVAQATGRMLKADLKREREANPEVSDHEPYETSALEKRLSMQEQQLSKLLDLVTEKLGIKEMDSEDL